jgi:hypothetical protein
LKKILVTVVINFDGIGEKREWSEQGNRKRSTRERKAMTPTKGPAM